MGADGGFIFVPLKTEADYGKLLGLTSKFSTLGTNEFCWAGKEYPYDKKDAPEGPYIAYGYGTDVYATQETPIDLIRQLLRSDNQEDLHRTMKSVLWDSLSDPYIWACYAGLVDRSWALWEPDLHTWGWTERPSPAHMFISCNFFIYTMWENYEVRKDLDQDIDRYFEEYCSHMGTILEMSFQEFVDRIKDCTEGTQYKVETWT